MDEPQNDGEQPGVPAAPQPAAAGGAGAGAGAAGAGVGAAGAGAPGGGPGDQGNVSPGSTIGGTLLNRLATIAEKILILRTTTVIGDVTNGTVTDNDGHLKVNFSVNPQQVACTTINMALGDLTTVYSPQFADNAAYAKLHSDNLAIARGVRSDTMDLLLKAVEAVKALAKL